MYQLIRTNEEALAALATIDGSQAIFCDTETYRDNAKSSGGLYGKVRLFQLYQNDWNAAVMIDCMFVDIELILAKLKNCWTVWHNASYDLHTINLYTDEVWLPAKVDDTLYMARLCLYKKTNRFGFYLCLKACKLTDSTIEGMDKTENQKADWGGRLTTTMLKYAACDVLYLSMLYDEVYKVWDTENYKLDISTLRYAIEFSRRGIPVDRLRLKAKLLEATTEYDRLMSIIPVNVNSYPQVRKLLNSTKSDMEALEEMRLNGNVMAGNIRDARQISKTITFIHNYEHDKIYGFFGACGAITGRTSCTGGDRYDHANLQQIPRRILDALIASDGHTFVYSDYAGVELRMAVAWIGEPKMHQLILDGVDLHSHTGSIVYNKPADSLTSYERMIGKICNFVLIYGGGVYPLKATIMAWGGILIPMSEVKAIHDAWFAEYTYFTAWHDMCRRAIKVYGYLDVTTGLGRTVRAYSFNDAVNIPIQGTCSEAQKTALVTLKARYPDENLVNTIHDSNTLMPLTEDAEMWKDRLNECMVEAWFHVIKDTEIPDLPMSGDAQINNRWEFK